MRYTLCFFPWVGIVIGALLWGWMELCVKLEIGRLTYILAGTAIPLIVTGGFHVDGYMDTMDAFHSYQPRERKLEILRDSHVGAFAVIMLLVNYLIYMAGFAEIDTKKSLAVFCLGFYLSRILSGIAVVSFPSAKKEGLLVFFADSAHKRVVRGCLYVQLAVCAAVMWYVSPVTAVCVGATAAAVFAYYRYRSDRELGGITGDAAGYFVTVCETAMAAAAAVGCRL